MFKKIVCKVRLLDLIFIRLEISVEVLIFKTMAMGPSQSHHRPPAVSISHNGDFNDNVVRFDQKQCVVNFHFKTYYDRQNMSIHESRCRPRYV